MKTVVDYLDILKEKNGSDYATAKLLKVEKSAISNIRRRHLMSDETAIKVADLLGIERDEVLIAAAIARSTGEVKTAWEKIGRMTGVAVSLVMVATLSNGTFSTGYSDALTPGLAADNMYYAKLYSLRSVSAI